MITIRLKFTIGFVLLLITEVLIALYVHDDLIRPYIGDVLAVAVLYCFIRIIVQNEVKFLTLYIFIFAAGVEGLQYFKLVERLGLQDNTFLRVLIGAVFDMKDIFCYGVGCVVIAVIESVYRKLNCSNNVQR